MNEYKTKQEAVWAGAFGDAYNTRNAGSALIASNLLFFSRSLSHAAAPASCLEFGANIGLNLQALRLLFPNQDQHAVEINSLAAAQLRALLPPAQVHEMSILDFTPERTFDLVLIKRVLVHICPEALPKVYDKMRAATGRYLLVAEEYSPSPVEMSYRDHSERLFKRDFCGEILDRYADLRLIDYGFVYHRDPNWPQDDINWFLMENSR